MGLTEGGKRVEIYTDGACSGNPGPGGWGAVLRFGEVEKELSGGEGETTNNRMELMAVIISLETLKRPCSVDVFSDSQYVIKGIKEWLPQWEKRGWKTANKSPVINLDLWQRLVKAASSHCVEYHWVRGHAGHIMNERADKLARNAIGGRNAAS